MHARDKCLEGIIYMIYIVSQSLPIQVFQSTRTQEVPNAPTLPPSSFSYLRAIWLWELGESTVHRAVQ